jgi:ethanolamine ammonia-lyase small subunit
MLDFQLAHARARDAVYAPLDVDVIARTVGPAHVVRSAAADRVTYLRRPDLGRKLDPESRDRLWRVTWPEHGWDAVFVVADGLSSIGVQQSAPQLLQFCSDRLKGWSLAPVVIATQARVALGDEIGELLNARLCVILIGERPGLSVANKSRRVSYLEPARGTPGCRAQLRLQHPPGRSVLLRGGRRCDVADDGSAPSRAERHRAEV